MSEQFDLTTHKRNQKGQIVKVQPYRLHIDGGTKMFERPPGSGMFYAENGELVKDVSAARKAQEKSERDALIAKIREEERAKIMADMNLKPEAPPVAPAPAQGDAKDPAAALEAKEKQNGPSANPKN